MGWNEFVENERQRDLDYYRIHGHLESDAPTWSSADQAGGLGCALTFVPLFMAAASMVMVGQWLASQGSLLRDVLEVFMPEGWLAQTPNGEGRPVAAAVAVGVVVLLILVGLFVTLRMTLQVLDPPVLVGVLIIFFFVTSFMACLIVGPVVVLGSVGVANGSDIGADVGEGFTGTWPWMVALLAPLLSSVLVTVSVSRGFYARDSR